MGMNTATLYHKSFDGSPEPADYLDAIERIEVDMRRLGKVHADRATRRAYEALLAERNAIKVTLRCILISRQVRDAHRGAT